MAQKKLTPRQKAAQKRRQQEYMYIFVHGKQKRISPPDALVEDGFPADKFVRKDADLIYLHQNEECEYIDQNEEIVIDDIPWSDEDIPF